jgi:hypothetical protein
VSECLTFSVTGCKKQSEERAKIFHYGVSQWSWLGECQQFGLRGLRVISFTTLERLAKDTVEHRRAGSDSDAFLVSLLPRELAKPYIG